MTPKRQMLLNALALRCVLMKAPIGPAKHSPVSVATGMASTPHGDETAPNRTMTSEEDPADQRDPGRGPGDLAEGDVASGVSGVACIAWYRPVQRKPPRTGNVASNEPVCITVETSRPGAMNARYDTPPMAALSAWSTNAPSPTPIASRNITGVRNEPTIDPRQVRR